jgi:hypothetical protein
MRLAKHMLIIVIMGYLFTGCSPSELPHPPDDTLISFLPTEGGAYLGDGDYYHLVTEIESIATGESEKHNGVILKGEVSRQTQGGDDRFEINLMVNGDALIQTTTGSQLNDSPLLEVVLLKAPVEKGRKWLFVTEDLEGRKQKITATILEVDDINKRVKVRYEGKNGYYEERTLVHGIGVVDFVRTVLYKGDYALTGYHLESNDLVNGAPGESSIDGATGSNDATNRIEIPTKAYVLIWGFNQAWVKKWQGTDDSILTFIAPESPALEKINAITEPSDDALAFVEFVPFEMFEEEGMTMISVLERYEDHFGLVSENRMKYTITLDFKIWDFERLK